MAGRPKREESCDEACARLAAAQHGVVSRAQALASGLPEDGIFWRVKSGRWEPILPGIYRVAGVPGSWHQYLVAACLWAGPQAGVSRRAAAALWNLEGSLPGPVEISTTRSLQSKIPWLLVHRVRTLHRSDLTTVSGIRVTTPTRTLIDLAGTVGPEVLERALDDALRRGLTSVSRLRRSLGHSGGRGRRGVAVLRRLLDERSGRYTRPESVLEARLIKVLRQAGLPEPTAQYEIREGGKVLARVDFAYPDVLLAIEADGYRFHSARSAWRQDRARRNALTSRGWRVLHVTWHDLTECPERIVSEVRALLL